MGSALPWALVALCFALGVASRSISDTFLVFVPALQHAFDANRGSVTLIYSFALLVGGTAAVPSSTEKAINTGSPNSFSPTVNPPGTVQSARRHHGGVG